MEIPGSASGSGELQCVGRLEIARPKPAGFLCGSIPVITGEAHQFCSAALVPSLDTVRAPRYQMIPTETDLNALPLLSSIPDRVFPIAAPQSKTGDGSPWQGGTIMSSPVRKGETLAVSGFVEYGDEVDVIAPTDILKQIFKIPYSKARVSIAVHRVGQTLVLNTGPDIEEGEKLIQRHNCQPKCVDQSLFLNFAMHSVRMEACDCPPGHDISSDEKFRSPSYSSQYMANEGSVQSLDNLSHEHASFIQSDDIKQKDYIHDQELRPADREKLFWGKKKNKKHKRHDAVDKVSDLKEKPRCPIQESEKYKRAGDDAFVRVLFWQFHNFRMLLGSDLLIFSNEKYVSVSLHLWDVSRKVTPLTWLEAWLDNFMACVPELAICYHQDGVVQGYELLKTDDIFLLKGISDDGTPGFQPHVVQQNGLSVLRFLDENCKQDPAVYWLYRSTGEDVIQLFDLSVIPQNHSPDDYHDSSCVLPSLVYRERSDSILSLGTILYRIAHRLSLSMSHNNKERCAGFLKKCLDFLDKPSHLVVRALAHEQFARLLLTYDQDLKLTSEVLREESAFAIADPKMESMEFILGLSASSVQDIMYTPVLAVEQPEIEVNLQSFDRENSTEMSFGQNLYPWEIPVVSDGVMLDEKHAGDNWNNDFFNLKLENSSNCIMETAAGPVSSKLAAIRHVSQAIKSLRWTRQLQNSQPEQNCESEYNDLSSPINFSVCACGDSDCIEVCDIREWLPTSKMDYRLLKLVLLLGESYLVLGEAYKDAGQLYDALKVIELACLMYGSMPQETSFVSSMVSNSLVQVKLKSRNQKTESFLSELCLPFDGLSPNYVFWAKAWTLVGDVFVEFCTKKDQESTITENKHCIKDLKMSSEVLKEVERLKKKMRQHYQNCGSCSLMSCSCQSDRANSGSSASSSTRDAQSSGFPRKQSKKPYGRNNSYLHVGNCGDDDLEKVDRRNTGKSGHVKHHKINSKNETCRSLDGKQEMNLGATGSEREDGHVEKNHAGSCKGDTATKRGGIFKYLSGSTFGDIDYTLSVSLNCYEEARKVMTGLPAMSAQLQSIVKKKGWVCNELGRIRLEKKDIIKAEAAFVEAIDAFRNVEDHTNIILINCNLGHGQRLLAEDMISKVEDLKKCARSHSASLQALETAKLQYNEALRYYGAAKTELNALPEKANPVFISLKNEVSTQLAHTYLKLGMLLARENTVAEIYENCLLGDYACSTSIHSQKEQRKHEISANDAIRAALSLYESMGDLRRQEAAYAHYQLACYQRDCCLRFLESGQKNSLAKVEVVQKVKQYASLAERNWQKSMDFYGPKLHPLMSLTILIDMSSLSFSLSGYLHSITLLESAITRLLEGGRHISEHMPLNEMNPEVCAKFWSQLQMLLKNMLLSTRATNASKCTDISPQSPSSKSSDFKKLSELYRMSLKSTDFQQLHLIHSMWMS